MTKEETEIEEQAPVAPTLDRKYIKGTPEHKAYKATKKPINGMPTGKMKEETELDEKMNLAKADMGDVITDFKQSDAPQFAGKSAEKRRQMAIAAKLQADRAQKEEREVKKFKQFREDIYKNLPVLEESVDVGDSDEASAAHQKYASKTAPTHEFKTDDGAHHKVWHHTSPSGRKTTLLHTKEAGASSAPVMKLNASGHHSPEDIKKSHHSYMNEELQALDEIEFDKSGKYVHKGTYGSSYQGDDDDDEDTPKKKPASTGEKRGRGRPAGSTSGARQKGAATGKKRTGVEYTGYPLHLPNSNK